MTTEELNKVKADYAQKGIDFYVDRLIKATETALFYKQKLTSLERKTKRSADEDKMITECKANIESYTDGIEELETHIEIMRSMLEAYSKNESVKL